MCGDRWLQDLEGPVPRNYREAHRRACERLQGRDPLIAAETAGVTYIDLGERRGRFEIPFLEQTYEVSWPAGRVEESGAGGSPSYVVALVLLHYLLTADGVPLQGRWVSFRDLPDARIYYPAFRAGSEALLLRRFGEDVAALEVAARALGGRPVAMADRAFVFQVLPRVPLAVLLWKGDEEFSPEIRLLFDASAGNYLPTEDLAVVGRYLCTRLLRMRAPRSA